MGANVEGMVRAAVEAIRAGKKLDARTLLERALELDEYNEQAWMWLSGVVDSQEEQRTCLENVLTINPNNDKARAGLKALGFNPPPAPSASASPAFGSAPAFPTTPAFNLDSADDLFADVDFNAPKAKAAPPANDPFEDVIATSSSSSEYKGPQLSTDDYDDWMAGLNIGKSKGNAPAPPPTTTSNLFGDDDLFGISTPTTSTSSSIGGTALFGDDPFGEDPFADIAQTPPAFAEDDAPYNPVSTPSKSFMQEPKDSFDAVISKPADVNYEALFDEDLLNDADSVGTNSETAEEDFFSLIPSEIATGRLPGTDESYPRGLLIGLGVAVLMNLGAFALLVSRLA